MRHRMTLSNYQKRKGRSISCLNMQESLFEEPKSTGSEQDDRNLNSLMSHTLHRSLRGKSQIIVNPKYLSSDHLSDMIETKQSGKWFNQAHHHLQQQSSVSPTTKMNQSFQQTALGFFRGDVIRSPNRSQEQFYGVGVKLPLKQGRINI